MFKYLKFLPFVVPKDVFKAFKLIKSLGAFYRKFDPMYTYFENFYIGKLVKNSETIRQIPVYFIKRWNVIARVEQDKARTNNSLESWHFVFSMYAKSHPTFNKLVEQFRLEQKNTDVVYAQLKSGDKYMSSKKLLEKDAAVKELVEKFYSFDKLFEFLDRLILILD